MPQLASGELGWAIDTQELYIGNGSVSEGAPAVGNTKLLTEHDDLFDLADTYVYDVDSGTIQTGEVNPIQRTLQDRLDDRVSVKAFGCNGDGTDCSAELQRAIDQLYLNANRKTTLYLEAGEYLISRTIYLPPFVTLVGEGKDKTVIKQTFQGTVFQTVNGNSAPNSPASDSTSDFLNQARFISVKGMTIDVTEAGLTSQEPVVVLQSCRNSLFEDIKILGSYSISPSDSIGIQMNSLSSVVTCKDNVFNGITIQDIGYAVDSKWDIVDNHFNSCVFDTLDYGVVFGNGISIGAQGQSVGPSYNVFDSCIFKDINKHAIWIEAGQYNLSTNNKFYSIGNAGGNNSSAEFSVINFNDEYNHSDNDFFDRASDLSANISRFGAVAYVPLIEGKSFFEYNFSTKIQVGEITSPSTLFRLPGIQSGIYSIEYWYNSSPYSLVRSGVLTIIIDKGPETVTLSDEYSVSGTATGQYNKLKFSAEISDQDGDVSFDTILINAENPVSGELANLYFKVASKT